MRSDEIRSCILVVSRVSVLHEPGAFLIDQAKVDWYQIQERHIMTTVNLPVAPCLFWSECLLIARLIFQYAVLLREPN